MRAAEPFDLAHLELRNRLVGTAHGRGIIADGLPLPEDLGDRVRLCIPVSAGERRANPNIDVNHHDPQNPLYAGTLR